ncbi:ArsR/SmtB family transcription factor [Aureibacillus halotolerans]|uniref:ArsR family transcriptional regulator n=1 Tax=Aureibacillus halotolerans TaxID=1508390 RepID=A0A4R6TXI9_9BACI|nr:metalloregulator ArsR/SmtB family transcription factor [Aureibacillus halotolerans]TDQ36585.1 ArsR family transcriptional regulator [Aureibacillus halotolerans]
MDIQTLSALAEPNRFQMVELLREGALTVGDISDRLSIRQPQVSKHLRVLHDAGIVEQRAEANRRYYALLPEPFQDMEAWVKSYQTLWEERYDQLDDYLAQLQKKHLIGRKSK